MVWLVADRVDIWHVATPLPLSNCPPALEQLIGFTPSLKVTVPVGGPGTDVADEIVKVNVTFCVTVDGFSDEVSVAVVPDLLITCGLAFWPPAAVIVAVLVSKLPSPL